MYNVEDDVLDISFNKYCEEINQKYNLTKKILLINPPQFNLGLFELDTAKKRGYYVYPPTGLLFLATALQSLNVEIEICDLNFEVLNKTLEDGRFNENSWKNILETRINKFNPSIVGVTCMFTNLQQTYEEVLSYLKNKNKFCILAGGTHASFESKDLLEKSFCDFVLTKDGEDQIRYLVGKLLSLDYKVEKTGGIFFVRNKEIFETLGVSEQPDIDIDITEAYKLISIEEYCKVGSLNQYSRIIGNDKAFSTVSMNRGCRGHCTFCSVRSLIGKKIRSRSAEKIIKELEYLRYERNVTSFDWLDDDLLANIDNCTKVFEKMIEKKLNLKWYANNGLIASALNDNLLKLMVDSGCVGFKIGIESGNNEMIKKIRKPATLNRLLEVSVLIDKYPELFVAGNYIIGFPDEKFNQMLDTFKFANKMNIDWAGFYICQPIKGAEAFNSFEAIGDERCKSKPENYLPARELATTYNEKENKILKGLEIFKINTNEEVSQEQLKEIWFVFGFVTNFINNKNLKPSGKVQKFIDWVVGAMDAYPYDAGMALFIYIGYMISGDRKNAKLYLDRCKEIYDNSEYWKERFSEFNLKTLLNPELDSKDIIILLDKIRRSIQEESGLLFNE